MPRTDPDTGTPAGMVSDPTPAPPGPYTRRYRIRTQRCGVRMPVGSRVVRAEWDDAAHLHVWAETDADPDAPGVAHEVRTFQVHAGQVCELVPAVRPAAARDVTDDDVAASVAAYVKTGPHSSYETAIRAALETHEARRAARSAPREIHVPVAGWPTNLHETIIGAPRGARITVPLPAMLDSARRSAAEKDRPDLTFGIRADGDKT